MTPISSRRTISSPAAACAEAIAEARRLNPGKPVEVEVESLAELEQALTARADIVMLDNFDMPMMKEAVRLNQGRAKLEVSGNVTLETLAELCRDRRRLYLGGSADQTRTGAGSLDALYRRREPS